MLKNARSSNAFLRRLLPVCKDVDSARNELRWLEEHATEVSRARSHLLDKSKLLEEYVARRARHEPLQYILGSEYFGDLNIKCKPGVLIPRQETAASVSHLTHLLARGRDLPSKLRVTDLCTGTGCIALHFHNELYRKAAGTRMVAEICGVDISPDAIALARENHRQQLDQQRSTGDSPQQHSLKEMRFVMADVFKDDGILKSPDFDILISNPPYISATAFASEATERSVREYEPKLALVPPTTSGAEDGDAFYPRVWSLARRGGATVALFEVGEMAQAGRVAAMAVDQRMWDGVEIWRDEPDGGRWEGATAKMPCVRGRGNARSIFAYRGEGRKWLGLG